MDHNPHHYKGPKIAPDKITQTELVAGLVDSSRSACNGAATNYYFVSVTAPMMGVNVMAQSRLCKERWLYDRREELHQQLAGEYARTHDKNFGPGAH